MSELEKSNWGQSEYSQEYRDHSDNYIQERATLLRILSSFYHVFVKGNGTKNILDLGCGDGVLSEILFAEDKDIEITVTDGSRDMIEAAQKRLKGLPVSEFCQITFDDILQGKFKRNPFDFIVSAFAIHHLDLTRKGMLYQKIFEMLKPGAYFVNTDVAETSYILYTDWYYGLWKEWIINREQGKNGPESFTHVPERARIKPENYYDPLQAQLSALGSAGFSEIECHYKYGLFTMYGGRKPAVV